MMQTDTNSYEPFTSHWYAYEDGVRSRRAGLFCNKKAYPEKEFQHLQKAYEEGYLSIKSG